MKNAINKYKYPLFAGIIVLCTFLYTYIISEVIPFGNNLFGWSDMFDQYIPFMRQFQELIRTGNLSFVSWSSAGGSDYITTFAYYLTSPFNLLLPFLSESGLYYFAEYSILIKFFLIAFGFGWFLLKQYNVDGITNVAFSLVYALSSFFATNFWNLIWLDSFIIFPFIIYSLIHRKWRPYTILLALSIWCNFYISFLICMILPIIFLFTHKTGNNKDFIKFIVYSILAGLSTAVVLFPVILGMVGKSTLASYESWIMPFKSFIEVYSGMFAFQEVKLTLDYGHAPMFCSIASIFLFPQMFISENFSIKEKRFFGIAGGIMLLAMNLPILNFVFNGLHIPIGIPNRFIFIFVFMIAIVGARLVAFEKSFNIKCLKITYICGVVLICLSSVPLWNKFLNILLLAVYFFLFSKNKKKLLCTILIIEMCVTCVYSLISTKQIRNIDKTILTAQQYDYKPYEQNIASVSNLQNVNDYLNIPSFTGFTSTISKEHLNLYKLGLTNTANVIGAHGFYHTTTSLLGIKTYLIQDGWSILDWEPIKERTTKFDLCLNPNNVSRVHIFPVAIKHLELTDNPATNLNELAKIFGNDKIFVETEKEMNYVGSSKDLLGTINLDVEEFELSLPEGKYSMLLKTRPLMIETAPLYDSKNTRLIERAWINNGTFETINVRRNPSKLSINYPTYDDLAKQKNSLKYRRDNTEMEFYLYREDEDVKTAKNIDSYGIKDVVFDGNMVTIQNNNQTGILTFGSLYSPGWRAYIDGKEVPTYKILDSLLAINVTVDDKEIVFEYTTPGIYNGIVISVVSIALIIFLLKKEGLHEE